MSWKSLLKEVLALLRDGRTADEFASHEASLGHLLASMEQTGNHRDGPVRTTLSAVGDRWSTLILEVLAGGPLRHSEVRRVIDMISAEQEISQRVLTLKLRALERDGLVLRRVIQCAPTRVDYQLTARGRELHGLVEAIVHWAAGQAPAILASRQAYDAQAAADAAGRLTG